MKEDNEVFSVLDGVIGTVFAILAVVVYYNIYPVYTYVFLIMHCLWIVFAIPRLLSILYFTESMSRQYIFSIIALSVINAICIFSLRGIGTGITDFLIALSIFELSPIVLIMFSFYVNAIKDDSIPRYYYNSRIYI